ncbi:hypothetical protein LTS08_002213 [Lithohypha guttulata]|uniref:Nudix hydrolase domain-containing protein n=1 Tax=Lithohypha guttulata TaxID=1690604 RepID=A0AAN7T620_9EURO|nr:hypothetical protein LTR05_001055 [Lithohypha guttulata]KAK5104325.1 hypothetical protein LTS08_002213 [Lithohypha guttulata]
MAESAYITDECRYNLPAGLTKDQLQSFPAYKVWISALTKTLNAQASPENPYHEKPYRLHGITIQAVDRFRGGRLGFLKLTADIRTDDGETIPGSIFMRGGSVAMLLILKAEDSSVEEEYVVLTNQPRIPAGTFSFLEIPAGMLDDSGTFTGAAAKEIEEETGLRIEESELINMSQLALQVSSNADPDGQQDVLQQAIYPSPGGSDEFIPLFLVRKTMQKTEIEGLEGKLTGLRDHGEKISLKIVRLTDAWKVAGRDAKTLSALCLYDGLRREGKL